MNKFEKFYRKIIHRLIVKYLTKCGSTFHHGAYGENGKYVRLFTDEEYSKMCYDKMGDNMKNITELQNLNDKVYKLVEILKGKQDNKETLTIQAYLLEDIADEMRELLND